MKRILLFAVYFLLLSPAVFSRESNKPQKTTNPVEQAVLKLEEEWERALVTSDVAALDRLYGDGLVYTHSSGSVDDKATYLGSIKSGVTKYESMKRDQIKVSIYGDTALVNCHWQVHVTSRGNKISTNAKYLHVWVKQKGRWQMVAHQATRLAQ
jgi:ketosteroid isomerase-like protein